MKAPAKLINKEIALHKILFTSAQTTPLPIFATLKSEWNKTERLRSKTEPQDRTQMEAGRGFQPTLPLKLPRRMVERSPGTVIMKRAFLILFVVTAHLPLFAAPKPSAARPSAVTQSPAEVPGSDIIAFVRLTGTSS